MSPRIFIALIFTNFGGGGKIHSEELYEKRMMRKNGDETYEAICTE